MSLREPVYVCKELSRSRNRPFATFNDLPRNNGFDALLAACEGSKSRWQRTELGQTRSGGNLSGAEISGGSS